ncbi:lysophospholipid acyltransferase family protein [Aliagarivorans taiwanensis]|uniref:lysophospholipid acyltransferase family protein n=1 Tax=Aliagarivorans taiwanensis TaxID=561966 RepID=UPI000404FEB2|nr:GNAT family N-acyltransferase [Aliagarivorans taiwanensis]
MTEQYNPFRITVGPRWFSATLERALGLYPLAEKYQQRPERSKDNAAEFLEHTTKALDFDLLLNNPEALKSLPEEGPLLIVANHPLGGLEGVAMSKLLLKYRPDLKVLTNELLATIPEFKDLFIGVDVLSKQAAKKNAKGIRTASKHLSSGGALMIYPAGQVSCIQKGSWKICDRQWNNLVGRLARRYKPHCQTFYVQGRNSRLFYLSGLIHPRLRTLMLPRELQNKGAQQFTMQAGALISPKDYAELESDQAVTDYLRVATELLSLPASQQRTEDSRLPPLSLVESLPNGRVSIRQQLDELEPRKLLSQREFSVYCAPYAELGPLMDEIALAREVTFRAVGEGTGKTLDSDQFDPHYWHLFVWDDKAHALVGGYRIGHAKEIIREHGLNALYSRSLYHFDESYIERLGDCLEMGRSFVVPKYQRHPRALDLLWQGIGHYVAKQPEHHTLFGCVSISRELSTLAQAFISDSMVSAFCAEQKYLQKVKPLTPLKVKGKVWDKAILSSISSISAINKLVGQCEPGRSIPILLRHYLALNGRFVCFSVNTSFNQSLDGLIVVDLRKTPEKYLRRYLGPQGCADFLAKWRDDEAAA